MSQEGNEKELKADESSNGDNPTPENRGQKSLDVSADVKLIKINESAMQHEELDQSPLTNPENQSPKQTFRLMNQSHGRQTEDGISQNSINEASVNKSPDGGVLSTPARAKAKNSTGEMISISQGEMAPDLSPHYKQSPNKDPNIDFIMIGSTNV